MKQQAIVAFLTAFFSGVGSLAFVALAYVFLNKGIERMLPAYPPLLLIFLGIVALAIAVLAGFVALKRR